jgi:SAM-dependent methyltransferase
LKSERQHPADLPGYIHGFTDEEAARLVSQADFLAPWVFAGLDLAGVGTLYEPGVGVGAETRHLLRRWPSLRVIGVDLSEGQLAHARRLLAEELRGGSVELVHASAVATPLPPARADAAFVCWLLEHVPDPAAVLRECARVVKPGGHVFVTEVYNNSMTLEPSHAAIERYWAALSATQRRAGGHPNIGARLGELAASAGLEVLQHRFTPVLGDARDPERRRAILGYFRSLMKSAEPQIVESGALGAADLAAVWAAWDEVERAADALFCYTMTKVEARVVSRS